jgi:TonB family protein
MTKKKVLVVDFDEKSAESLGKFLEEEGYDVLVACDGETGLEKAKQEKPDLVILEPMLPKLHGFELCGIITHDLEPRIPVVILTKFYREEQFKIESLRSFGASAFVSKPFQRPEMRQLIIDLITGESGTGDELNGMEIPDSLTEDTLEGLQASDSAPVPDMEAPQMMESNEMESKKVVSRDLESAESKPEESEPKESEPEELEPEKLEPKDLEPEELAPEGLGQVEKEPEAVEQEDLEPKELQPEDQDLQGLEPKEFQPGNLEKELMASVSNSAPPSTEPRMEDDFAQELDAMMQDAFSDFGLGGSEKKTAPPNTDAEKNAAPPVEDAPEAPVSESESADPDPKALPQDNVLQKLEEIARDGIPEPTIGAPVLEAQNMESSQDVVARAETVAESIERELEIKVEQSASQEPEHAEPDPKVGIPDEAQEPAADSALEQESVRLEGHANEEQEEIFDAFGDDEEEESGSSFFRNILGRLKGVPTKIVVPFAAIFVIILVSLLIILKPDKSNDSSGQQASLGVTTIGQPLPEVGEGGEGRPGEENQSGEDMSARDPGGPGTSIEGSRQSDSIPAEKSQADPAPPPRAQPPVTAEIQEAEMTPQLVGGLNPTLDTEDRSLITQQPPQTRTVSSSITDTAAAGLPETVIPSTLIGQSEDSPPSVRETPKIREGDIVSIQQVDQPPEAIHKEIPRFPPAARGRGVSGIVMINTLISETGDVLQTVVIRRLDSPYGFNQTAENAVKKWKFSPATKDGVRVKVWKAIPIAFKENTD